jgi:Ca2+-binding RTX toxin-like protein
MTVDLSTLGDVDDLDNNDTITGGAGSDTLLLKATGTAVTAANIVGVTKIETIKISNDLTTGAINLNDANIADGATLTVDGTAIISDGNVLTVVGTNETNGSLTVLGGAGADAITGTASDLGDTLSGNGGDDQFNFATANLTKLDTVDGGAGTKDKINTSDGGTLVDADFTGVSNVELVTFGAGTTVTLDTLADAAGLTSFTHGAGTNSVTLGNTTTSVSGFDNDYTVNLVASTKDTIDGTLYAGKMTVAFANMDHIDAGAVITGGTGTNDTLSIDQTNTALTSAELANIKGIENFTLKNDEATAAITLNNNNTAAGKSIKVDGSAMISTNALTISAANEADGFVTIIGGTAGDTLTMSISGAGGDTITAGSGDDTINVAVANYTSLDTVDGGAGTADTLALSSGGTLSDVAFGGTTNVEKLTTANANTTLILGEKAAAAGVKTITTLTGSNTNSITLGADFTNDATVVLVDNTDTVQATSYTGKATVTVAEDNLTAADTITGGSGTDTLTVTFDGNNTDALTAAEMAAVTKIEVIKAATNAVGSLGLADANVAKGASIEIDVTKNTSTVFVLDASAELDGSVVYKGGAVVDTVTGGAKNDTISGGAGADVITGGKGADSITGGAGADVFTYTAADQSTTNSTDTIVDYVTGTDKFAITLDFNTQVNALTFDATVNTSAKGSAAVASGLSAAIGQVTYDTTNSQMVVNANADNLISTSDYVVNVTAAATAANSIVEGDVNFTITGGSAGDTIVAGGGADTINGGAGIDTIDGGAGADTINGGSGADNITGGAGADTLNGGAGADVYTVGVGSGIDTIDVTAATDIDKIVTDAVSSDDYFDVTNFAVGNDLIDYNGAVASDNGTKTAIQGNEGGAIADVASINTAKTTTHISTAMGTANIIDLFLAGTKTLTELKTDAIGALDDGSGGVGVTAGLDIALSDASVVIVFTIDNEDTAIWRFDNEDTVANKIVASELELIGIVQGDKIDNTEMGTIMI